MLKTPTDFDYFDNCGILQIIAGMEPITSETNTILKEGVAIISHFGSSDFLRATHDAYPLRLDSEYNCYGVCDSIDDILKAIPLLVDSLDREFFITLKPILRENESSEGGWRWHKWGDYIGTQNPEHEYIYDDKHIDKVYCYHIYEKKNLTQKGT